MSTLDRCKNLIVNYKIASGEKLKEHYSKVEPWGNTDINHYLDFAGDRLEIEGLESGFYIERLTGILVYIN